MKNSKRSEKIENKILCLLGTLNLPKEEKRIYLLNKIDTYESKKLINEQSAKELRELVKEVLNDEK